MAKLRSLSRDVWLALGLFLVLTVVTAVALAQEIQEPPLPPLTSYSTQPDGAKALWLWLETVGYGVSDDVSQVFRIPEGTTVILMLEPLLTVGEREWDILDAWVEEGGILIIAGERIGTWRTARHYDFRLEFQPQAQPASVWETPLFRSPSMGESFPWSSRAYWETPRDDFVIHLTIRPEEDRAGLPVLVSWQQGNGRVVLSSSAVPFSNEGLKEDVHAALMMNVLTTPAETAQVWFNEWHHGAWQAAQVAAGPGEWLQQTPLGRSFLYIGLILLVYLLLRGQLFGRPVPPKQAVSRRAPLEYITAIANLSRRAGHRRAVLLDYHDRLKRHLGRRYRLDPTMPDDAFVQALSEFDPNVDKVVLNNLLHRLSKSNVTETEMVQLAAEVAKWI